MSIEIKNITKKYGEQKALDNISFDIKTGEIVGFLGPNGAGKSTMMKIITGFIGADKGKVLVNGIDINTDPMKVRKMIGYLPENNPLYLEMYVKEYLEFVAGIYKLQNKKDKVTQIIDKTGLTRECHKKIGALSKGYRQRVGLAQALIHDPEVLILDEPTTGLDPNQIVEIRNLISEVGKEKTVMLSTHIMQEVEAICDKVIIINRGQIVANESAELIQNSTEHKHLTITVEFNTLPSVDELLTINGIKDIKTTTNNLFIIETSSRKDIREDIFRFAVNKGISVLSMQKEEKTLEDVFRELTK